MSEVIIGEVVEHRTPEEWGEVIRADLARSVEGIIDAGRHLIEAKATTFAKHGAGEWLAWIKRELPIGPRAVRYFMQLARHEVISDRKYTSALPPAWRTLAELAKLEPADLKAAIESGRVTPELQQKQARSLVAEYKATGGDVGKPTPRPEEGKYATILADPPWHYGNAGTRGAARDHYPTMTIDELCALDVAANAAADDAHLYMWTTAGHLPDAFQVMKAWGFTYKTFLVWVKPQIGMGNYFRVSAELVLFGIRGELRINDRGIRNWFEAKRGKHSAKPESFYELVKRASPGPYLEMFARCRRDTQLICGCARCQHGWDVWGNEA